MVHCIVEVLTMFVNKCCKINLQPSQNAFLEQVTVYMKIGGGHFQVSIAGFQGIPP